MFDPLRQDPKLVTLALAGASGGLLRWIALRPKWQDGLIAIGAGIICSYYFADVLAPILVEVVHALPYFGQRINVTTPQMVGPGGLLSGVVGISMTGFILDWTGIISRTFLKKQRDNK